MKHMVDLLSERHGDEGMGPRACQVRSLPIRKEDEVTVVRGGHKNQDGKVTQVSERGILPVFSDVFWMLLSREIGGRIGTCIAKVNRRLSDEHDTALTRRHVVVVVRSIRSGHDWGRGWKRMWKSRQDA
jgi:hypothetical protein